MVDWQVRQANPWTSAATVIGVALVLCLGVPVLGAFVSIGSGVRQSFAPVEKAAAAFFDDLRADRVDAAYEQLCPDTREHFDLAGFRQATIPRGPLRGYRLGGGLVNNGGGFARLDATLTHRDRSTQRVRFVDLRRVDGRWQVCGDPW